MRARHLLTSAVVLILPSIAAAQAPVADAFRWETQRSERNLIAAAVLMPADKYSFKPTPAQMSFGDVVAHLAGGNDALCGLISGTKAPSRSEVTAKAAKDVLIARLRETFTFCNDALAKLDDSNLGEKMTVFGTPMTRATAMMVTADDWGDHYSQAAIYLRLNNLLPPTAPKPAAK